MKTSGIQLPVGPVGLGRVKLGLWDSSFVDVQVSG